MKTVPAPFLLRGGCHPADAKQATAAKPIEAYPIPKTLWVSLAQHLGVPVKPLVKKGDPVRKGQPIAEPTGLVAPWVHAPTSGTVKSIGLRMTASNRYAMVVEIESDGQDLAMDTPVLTAIPDWEKQPPKTLIDQILKAGVIGMGGAGFPTHVKLSPPPGKKIDTLIINGAECEPFLTADHRLMVEETARICSGIRILRHILGGVRLRVGIEDNKPDAIAAMSAALQGLEGDVELVVLKTSYPQGAEKQLIYSCTRREIPSGGLPMDVGALVENVGTAAAVHDAVVNGLPLIERVTTVGGNAIRNPKNIRARIGTPLALLVECCGGFTDDAGKFVSGGPMMGIALPSTDAGTDKTTSGLLAFTRQETKCFSSMPCISCSRCIHACPMGLLPSLLSESMEAENVEQAEELCVMDCIECGSCAYECPAHRPLVQHMRHGKTRVLILRSKRAEAQKKGIPA